MVKNLTWQAVALIAMLGGVAVALLTLTDLTSGEVMGVVGVLAGVAGAAVGSAVGNGVTNRVEEIHAETQAQTATIETIERRTNGELDARIEAGMERAVAEVVGALRAEGVLRAAAAPSERQWFGPPGHPGRGGLPLAGGGDRP